MTSVYIGIDDTDNAESRGTGHLARMIADQLAPEYAIHGIVRHQLFFDRRVPYTSHNSSASILLSTAQTPDLPALFARVKALMLSDFQQGSDPGLCVAVDVPEAVTRFGQTAKVDLVTQAGARQLAAEHAILLEGLGGTQDGVIGALSAVGLARGGSDGRYVRIGTIRSLQGWQPLEAVLAAGIEEVRTLAGEPVLSGMILADKLRPARRDHRCVLFVEAQAEGWLPLKLD